MADRLQAGTPGKSNLTPEWFLEQYQAWRAARREQSESSSTVMTIKKKMKNGGVDLRALDLMEKLNDLDADEAGTVLKSVMRYATWCGMPFAAQQKDLFSGLAIEKPNDDAAQQYRVQRAHDDGYFAGKDGQLKDRCPHQPGGEEYARWIAGWMEGSAKRADAPARGRPRIDKTAGASAAADATPKKGGSRKKSQAAASGAASIVAPDDTVEDAIEQSVDGGDSGVSMLH